MMWCREPDSNWRHRDFQSRALPTELSRPAGAVVVLDHEPRVTTSHRTDRDSRPGHPCPGPSAAVDPLTPRPPGLLESEMAEPLAGDGGPTLLPGRIADRPAQATHVAEPVSLPRRPELSCSRYDVDLAPSGTAREERVPRAHPAPDDDATAERHAGPHRCHRRGLEHRGGGFAAARRSRAAAGSIPWASPRWLPCPSWPACSASSPDGSDRAPRPAGRLRALGSAGLFLVLLAPQPIGHRPGRLRFLGRDVPGRAHATADLDEHVPVDGPGPAAGHHRVWTFSGGHGRPAGLHLRDDPRRLAADPRRGHHRRRRQRHRHDPADARR